MDQFTDSLGLPYKYLLEQARVTGRLRGVDKCVDSGSVPESSRKAGFCSDLAVLAVVARSRQVGTSGVGIDSTVQASGVIQSKL